MSGSVASRHAGLTFGLALYDALTARDQALTPRPALLLDPARTQVSWTTLLPGGFGTLTVGMPEPFERRPHAPGVLPTPVAELDYQVHVVLSAGSRTLFEGQVVELSRGRAGLPIGFIAEGYAISALEDAPWLSTSTAPSTSGAIVAAALARCSAFMAPHVDFNDPLVAHAASDFDDMTFADLLNQIQQEGDGSGNVWDYGCWEGARFFLAARTPPTPPDWQLDWDAHISEWREDYRKVASGITVRYQRPNDSANQTYTPPVNPTFPYRTRTAFVDGSQLTDAGAESFARAYAALHAAPQVAITVQAALADPLRRGDGGYLPAYLLRAGDWATVAGHGPYIVTRVEADAARGTVRAVLGDYWSDVVDLWRQIRRYHRAVQRRTHPVTGAKLKSG